MNAGMPDAKTNVQQSRKTPSSRPRCRPSPSREGPDGNSGTKAGSLQSVGLKTLKGRVCKTGEGAGCRHFSHRMTQYPGVFEGATGEKLFPGTLNVNVGVQTPVTEHFRIHGQEINESEEFLFEVCQINGIWAYRIRLLDAFGTGGHGDHILEISCSRKLPYVSPGTEVEITLFPLSEQELIDLKRRKLRGREIAEALRDSLRLTS